MGIGDLGAVKDYEVELFDQPFSVVVTTKYFWGEQRIRYYEGAITHLKLKYCWVSTSVGGES